jgi:hypothetical protein
MNTGLENPLVFWLVIGLILWLFGGSVYLWMKSLKLTEQNEKLKQELKSFYENL